MTASIWFVVMMACFTCLVSSSNAYPGRSWQDELEEIRREMNDYSPLGEAAPYVNEYYNGIPRDIVRELEALYAEEEPKERVPQLFESEGVLDLVEDWPKEYITSSAGQIGGVAVDRKNNVHVFHRGNRVWDESSFNENNTYMDTEAGPIAQDTLLVMSEKDGKVLHRFGKKQFYLPHGLTLDKEGFYWLTDVATHQVYKMNPTTNSVEVILGKKFEPAESNDDMDRLCKPTDVAVADNGEVFIADGYCNQRILKLAPNGTVLDVIVEPSVQVAHSLALAEDLDLLCLADRDNGRILCYKAGLDGSQFGEPDRMYNDPILGRVFAITYEPNEGFLYAMTESSDVDGQSQGITIDLAEAEHFDGDIVAIWRPSSNMDFKEGHDLAVSDDGNVIYTGTVDANASKKVWKFIRED